LFLLYLKNIVLTKKVGTSYEKSLVFHVQLKNYYEGPGIWIPYGSFHDYTSALHELTCGIAELSGADKFPSDDLAICGTGRRKDCEMACALSTQLGIYI
jgi:hypothetical protein